MKKTLITILCLWSLVAYSQSPSGTDSTYLLPANNRTPMNAKWYDFSQYISNGKALSVRGKAFVYDSTFLKGPAYSNQTPSAGDSGTRIANTEWVKQRLASYGPGRDTITFATGEFTVTPINAQNVRVEIDTTFGIIPTITYGNAHWGGGGSGWGLTGNSGTTAGTNFLGTTDNVDMVFKRSGTIAGRIGTSNTSYGLNSNRVVAGSTNTAFGQYALGDNTTGNANTGLGSGALGSITTGSNNNIGIGKDVGFNLVSGSDNVLVGTNIMTSVSSTTSNNVAIGVNALLTNSSGGNHSVIGKSAYAANTTGTQNTGLGYTIGGTNTTGSRNLLLGYQADVATSSTNGGIALGYNANAITNQLAISDSVVSIKAKGLTYGATRYLVHYDKTTGLFNYADTSSGGGTPAGNTGNLQIKGIDGNFYTPGGDSATIADNGSGVTSLLLKGYLGIGTTTPTEKLHVKDGNLFVENGNLTVTGTVKARNVIGSTVNATDANFTADAGKAYVLPDPSTARTITFPVSPQDADVIRFYVPQALSFNWNTSVTFILVDGTTDTALPPVSAWLEFAYDGANSAWRSNYKP